MPGKTHDLFDAIAAFPALHAAALRAATGKRAKPGVAAFLANLETEVLRLERELRSGRYRPGRYKTIEVFDPKHRVVSAAPFRDRVVHHALCAVCEPLFERGFIHDSYANRKGKGTHRAVARYERFRDRWRAGRVAREEVERRVGAWVAHAGHAHTWRLRHALFRDGCFDPSREPGRPPAGGCCAAVPGTTNPGTSAPPTATGTPPATGTTTTGSALPARSAAGAGGLTGPPGAPVSVQGRS